MHDYALHKSTFTLLYFTWLSLSQVSQGVAQSYLADELCHPADTEARRRLYVLSRQHCWLSAVNRQRPSFTCRRPSCMERSSAARHVSTVTGHLPQSPQDPSLQVLLPMTSHLCFSQEVTTDQPHRTICHQHYSHRTCRRVPSSGH